MATAVAEPVALFDPDVCEVVPGEAVRRVDHPGIPESSPQRVAPGRIENILLYTEYFIIWDA